VGGGKNEARLKKRVKVYNARLALIMFYNARQVLNTRTTRKTTREENNKAWKKSNRSREKIHNAHLGQKKENYFKAASSWVNKKNLITIKAQGKGGAVAGWEYHPAFEASRVFFINNKQDAR
jgi:hypothetical protein